MLKPNGLRSEKRSAGVPRKRIQGPQRRQCEEWKTQERVPIGALENLRKTSISKADVQQRIHQRIAQRTQEMLATEAGSGDATARVFGVEPQGVEARNEGQDALRQDVIRVAAQVLGGLIEKEGSHRREVPLELKLVHRMLTKEHALLTLHGRLGGG